ncbi:MAG: hypothetical protein GWN67_10970 [Phycisphaerae bacterium]|nr:hypothetical protein [Phycisphaerae bacterium]NIP52216.1 hypothetical protein [Phycisphaerae bacterium]NIS51627.1 hypothetical protein [Phycisphaerae bacterium]NIU09218.1 hypothetical protein [Phycisphaerae bacterium]NIU56879.1 hypothetical protein [Phycisphaerae bacterium]
MEKKISKKVNLSKVKTMIVLCVGLLMTLSWSTRAEVPDYGNDCNSAEPIDPNGSIVEGVLSDTADEDWFSFTAVADGLYEMTLLSQSGTKYLCVWGPDGCPAQLQVITEFVASTGTVTNEVFIEHAGTYYIKVYYGSGLYRFSVNEIGTYPTDTYPDTCVNPAVLIVDDPCGPMYDGITDYGMDEDWFSFATTVLHKYQVNFYRPLNTDVVYDLYRSNCGVQLSGNQTGSMTFVSLDGANYDLRVKSYSFNKEGYFGIWVEDLGEVPDDHGNTCDVATPIATNGVEVEGRIQYTANLFSDEDWFGFTATANGLYEMTFLSQSGTKYLYLYGPDGCPGQLQQIVSLGASIGTTTAEVFIEHAGTYYIKIPSDYSTGLYRVSVNELGFYPTDSYADICPDANVLIVDDPCGPMYDGITDYGMDEDWFSFATTVLHKYQVNFYGPLNTNVVYDLYRSNCGVQLRGDQTGSMTFVSLDGANYDLRVKSSSFNKEGYYEIWVDNLGAVPDDYGNTCEDATLIVANSVDVNGALQYSADLFTDEDWFSFTAPVTGTYQICLWSQSRARCLYVYGPDGCPGQLQSITNLCPPYAGGTTCGDISISNVGTYYIQVSGDSGLYSVSVLSPLPECGDSNHPYPIGDMNHDCVLNFKDIATIANNWLVDNRPPP